MKSVTPLVLGSVATLALSVGSSAQAWTLLDNFDSYSTGATTDVTGGVWSAEFVGTANSNVVADDFGNSLQTKGGAAWRGAEAVLSQWNADTAIGATNTYFYQFKALSDGASFDIMMGLSADVSNIDTSNAWQDFAVMPFLAGAGDGTADFNMSDAGLADDDIISDVNLGEWYNVWYVVNNDAETYDVYVSQGTDDGTFIGTAANYRNGFTNTALNAIGFMAAGGTGGEVRVDNVYFSEGVDTTYAVPEPGSLALLGLGGLLIARRRRD